MTIPRKARPRRISAKRAAEKPELLRSGRTVERSGKPIPQRNAEKRQRRASKNAKYYASAEWREKKKLTHERDGYQCVENLFPWCKDADCKGHRCPNRGEIVNGKQTARGLVCEEVSYGHRGIPQRIDTCKTRCKDCDRRLTPLERANHAQGFQRVLHGEGGR